MPELLRQLALRSDTMIAMRASTVALVLALASCSPKSDPEPAAKQPIADEQKPMPAPRPTLDLGPLIGRPRELTTPTAGRYALSLQAKQHRFVTMEITIDSSVNGGASIDLREDGTVHACFWGTDRSSGSISKYASDDGQHHHNETNTSFRMGMWGTWTAEPEAARATLQLTSVDHRSCERSDAAIERSPVIMTCHAIAAGDGLPVPAIICRFPADQHRLEQLAMALVDHPRSGPWAIREDSTGRYPQAFGDDVQPWLLLGSPGLLVRAQDRREGQPIDVTLTEADVQTPEGALEQR